MFAPFHRAAADELVRVTKPGGTIGLINWTPIAAEPDRIARLDRKLAGLASQHDLGNGRMEWEYLLVTARRPA